MTRAMALLIGRVIGFFGRPKSEPPSPLPPPRILATLEHLHATHGPVSLIRVGSEAMRTLKRELESVSLHMNGTDRYGRREGRAYTSPVFKGILIQIDHDLAPHGVAWGFEEDYLR